MTGPLPRPCPHEHEDAAYVLGALVPDERAAFERHLPTCAACTAAVAELAGLPGLLSRVPIDVADPPGTPPPVPDTLLPRLVHEVRATRRRRSWLVAATVGTAAAVAAIALGFAVTGRDDGPTAPTADPGVSAGPSSTSTSATPAAAVSMRAIGDEDDVTAQISLTAVTWGTRIELTCDERGVPGSASVPAAWSSYAMVVHTRDGREEQVASWQAQPGAVVHVSGATAADRGDIVDVDVRNADGVPVLDLGR